MRYSDLQDALSLLGIPPSSSIEDIKRSYRKKVKRYTSHEELVALNKAYRLLMDYCTCYPFNFTKEEYYKVFPEEGLRDKFFSHPLWPKDE